MENEYSFQLKDKSDNELDVKIIASSEITFIIKDVKSLISGDYSVTLKLEDFQKDKYCRYFRLFDSIEEIFKELKEELNLPKNSEINIENNIATLTIKILNGKYIFSVILPGKQINTDEIVVKLCDKIKEIDYLKSKIKSLMNY